jgi:hypothetical protein
LVFSVHRQSHAADPAFFRIPKEARHVANPIILAGGGVSTIF